MNASKSLCTLFVLLDKYCPNFLYVVTCNVVLDRMFEQFSKGYYLGRLYVEPSNRDKATMCREQHEWVNEQLYVEGTGIERLDRPLVMKVGSQHLAVHGNEEVPADTLSVPDSVLAETDVRNPPSLQEVLLAKAERASQLLKFTGGTTGR